MDFTHESIVKEKKQFIAIELFAGAGGLALGIEKAGFESIDQFYSIVTGQEDAFYQMCTVLPRLIKQAIESLDTTIIPHDTVISELKTISSGHAVLPEDASMAKAIQMLGFATYIGFNEAR